MLKILQLYNFLIINWSIRLDFIMMTINYYYVNLKYNLNKNAFNIFFNLVY